jgi:hypothetical protein
MSTPSNDASVEDHLRRFRPAGPPASLRARIVTARPPDRAWPWALSASAAFVLVVALRMLTNSALASAPIAAPPDPWSPVTSALVLQSGDTPRSRHLASILVDSARRRMATSPEAARARGDQQ